MAKKTSSKSVFLIGTYEDQIDCIEEVKSLLAELGIIVHHFKEGGFQDGRLVHSHDRCLEKVHEVKNYLLILDRVMGSDYEGEKIKYKGLSITEAEFEEAYDESVRNGEDNMRLFLFCRRKVHDSYDMWKKMKSTKDKNLLPADEKVYQFLYNMKQKGCWVDPFEHSSALKKELRKIIHSFNED